jgi:hypothetical protein
MTRREIALSVAVVFVVALVVRVVAASLVVFPQPEDTAYYVGVARNLLAGHGLTSDALWSYQTPPLTFPRPAFEVWLPLPTFLTAIPMAILGPTFAAAQVSPIVVGSIVPVLAWRLGADVALERRLPRGRVRVLALGAGLTSAIYLPLVLHSTLPDSTMPFAVLALGACILMPRLLRDAGRLGLSDVRLIGLGVLIGLAALARNEAVFIGFAWLVGVWRVNVLDRRRKVALVAVPAVVALAVFAPWMVRDWLEFHNPLPGQALANALSVTGFDIFAWNDPPSLSRYLAQGPSRLLEMRAEGLGHNLFTVLLLPGIPAAFVGLVALPFCARLAALQPLIVLSVTTFAVTSLVFPVSTTWGTYLHAAGPAHVLLLVCALLALDGLIERIGRIRRWTRPVAWLGAALTIFGSLLFMVALMPSFGGQSRALADRYEALDRQLTAAGLAPAHGGPIITDFPIWLAEATGARALALPDESPADVLDLAAAFPGTRLLIVNGDSHGSWPDVLASGAKGSGCFEEVDIGASTDARLAHALDETRVFRLVCP